MVLSLKNPGFKARIQNLKKGKPKTPKFALMENCCTNAFKICNQFANCFTGLKVRVPAMTGEMNGIELLNNQRQGNFFGYQQSDIVDGFVTLNLATLADGFLNPFGNPYSIRFMNNDQTTIEFTATDGETHDGILFEIGKYSASGDVFEDGVISIDVVV